MSYSWDSRGRLQSITPIGGGTATFRYDYAGNLIEKTVNGKTEKYILDEITNIAYQEDSSGLRMSVLSGFEIDQHFGIVKPGGGIEFGLVDAINSTVATVDETGALRGRFSYEPYGETMVTGSTVFPFRFTGRMPAAGSLYYYRARYYDPVAGRFVSEDPIGFASGDYNLFRYVGGKPLHLVDPTGKFSLVLVKATVEVLFIALTGKLLSDYIIESGILQNTVNILTADEASSDEDESEELRKCKAMCLQRAQSDTGVTDPDECRETKAYKACVSKHCARYQDKDQNQDVGRGPGG